ncbi:MAG: helix-turn-helix transcriptional regulator [Bacteroidota bacterium]|nr:helix-turn-helix transcriptional regulator [Bacteroidota bacterium]MEC8683867.1 helix-turn-helix transcriptional regulator [Bacteroidota bacterium]MEE3149196.1 helix-turn-helix transcriptional regulator [Bacteroidota bacterium]MEE3225136.1 helix-turn-helix transcriptional regulator [Bacteroidota bacterium]
MKTNPIKKLRQMAGLSQLEMAERVGEAQGHISRYERDKSDIALSKFLTWCDKLEVTDFNTLFNDE